MLRSIAVLVFAACGGGSHASPKQPAPAEKPDAFWDWHRSQPKSPEEPVRTTRFEPPQACGQGPYRFTIDGISAPFSESIRVTICTAHEFKGSVSYAAPGYGKSDQGFGTNDSYHDRCRVDATVIATPGATTSGGGGSAKPEAKGKAKAATTKAAPVVVELHGEVVAIDAKCPSGMSSMTVVNHSYTRYDEQTVPSVKGPITLELWSELPNDLKGVSLLVEQRGVPAGFKVEDWKAYRHAYDEWVKGHDAALAKSIAQGNQWKTVEPVAVTAQPPPARAEAQSPRPSPNASWVPGYWQNTDGWVWSAGFWRVPQQDIEREITVEAPTPPPALRTEAPPDVAYHQTRHAVWTPGHWMWNGQGYVWIVGAWRIPEAADMVWVAPTWRPNRRGTSSFVPGGFVRMRIRAGR